MGQHSGLEGARDGRLQDPPRRLPTLKLRKTKQRLPTADGQQEETVLPLSYSQPFKKFVKLKVPRLALEAIT